MIRKLIIPIIVLVVIIAVGMSCWQAKSKGRLKPKTTGLPIKVARYYWPGMYWVEIADKKGWFKEAGLSVELIDTNPDYNQSLNDMAAGKMDSNNYYLFDLVRHVVDGADLVAVINADISFGMDAIVVKPGIERVLDLRGKTVGLSKDSNSEYALDIVLERSGLTLDDVVIKDMPGEKTSQAFIKGEVDAISTWEPLVTEAIEKGRGHKLFDSSEIAGIMPAVTVFHKKFIKERPQDVQAYVNVWHKTTQFIKENPKEAFQIIADIYKRPRVEVAGLAQIDKLLDLRDNQTAFSYSTGFESLHGAVYKINDFMLKKGITDKHLDSLEFLDGQFIRALQREQIRDEIFL